MQYAIKTIKDFQIDDLAFLAVSTSRVINNTTVITDILWKSFTSLCCHNRWNILTACKGLVGFLYRNGQINKPRRAFQSIFEVLHRSWASFEAPEARTTLKSTIKEISFHRFPNMKQRVTLKLLFTTFKNRNNRVRRWDVRDKWE